MNRENESGTKTYLNISTFSSALETYKFSMKYFSWAAEFVPVIGFRLDIAAILSPESSKFMTTYKLWNDKVTFFSVFSSFRFECFIFIFNVYFFLVKKNVHSFDSMWFLFYSWVRSPLLLRGSLATLCVFFFAMHFWIFQLFSKLKFNFSDFNFR